MSSSVKRTGMELVATIDPSNDKTPTLGRDRSLFEELFGNIGAVGQARPAPARPPTTRNKAQLAQLPGNGPIR